MKLRRLALFPLVWIVLFALALAVVPESAHATLIRTEIECAKLLGLTGCIAAASAFGRGDYLRRAWSLHGLCFSLLLLRDGLFLWFRDGSQVFGVPHDYLFAALVFVANGAAVVGTFMASRAWQVAGIELPGSKLARSATIGVAVVVALTITGNATWNDLRTVLSGDPRGLVPLASDAGDIVSLCLVAPVFLTALAMRGGILMWPWGLLTASLMSWLVYDAAATFGPHLFASTPTSRICIEMFRALACTFSFAAGLAQRAVLHQEGPHGVEPPRGLGISSDV
jgi:hypothetical protein